METRRFLTSSTVLFALAHNSLGVDQLEDGYFRALRFSKEQAPGYSSHALYRAMAKTSSSVCLRLYAQSTVVVHLRRYNESLLPKKGGKEIDFTLLYPRPFDISETIDVVYEKNKTVHLPLASKQIVIEKGQVAAIYLPLYHQVGFLIEGEAIPVPKHEKTLLCIGDSIIQGLGAHHPLMALCEQISQLKGIQVLNQGLAGSLVNPKLIQKLAIPVHSILVALGTNDWVIRENLAELRGEMFALLGRIRKYYPEIPV
ncbi:MAG: SGNH/GDSL hydrolase family protein, partial [Sphaerochaetaceae bacterium]